MNNPKPIQDDSFSAGDHVPKQRDEKDLDTYKKGLKPAEAIDLIPHLKIGEIVQIKNMRYRIKVSNQLDTRSLEPLMMLKKVE